MNKRGTHALTFNPNLKLLKSKHAQVTIFVIIAIILVAAVLAYFIFKPEIITKRTPDTPQGYMEACLNEKTEQALNILTSQGGYIEPEFYKLYQDKKIAYLCYTEEHYKGCTMQIAFLKQHIEKQIKNEIQPKAIACLNGLKEQLTKKNNKVTGNLKASNIEIEILPDEIITTLNTDITITKDTSQKITKFETSFPSPLYNQIMISSSILNWEARYGDSDPLTYMLYYPNIKVEKKKLGDGSTIYILTDRPTEQKFMFASRSFIWPAGYLTPPT